MAKKTILTINAEKEGLRLIVKIKADKIIESFYSGICKDTETSKTWLDGDGKGLVFYKSNEELAKMYDIIKSSNNYNYSQISRFFDDFGSGLNRDGNINLAILRIKGISEGKTFIVNDLATYEDLKTYIARLAENTKVIYKEFIQKCKVKAKITFEI